MNAAVLELAFRTSDEVFCRARDEHIPPSGLRCDASSGMDGNPGQLSVDHLALAGVQAGAHVETELDEGIAYGAGAKDCACGRIEGREEAGTSGMHLRATRA